MSILVWIEQIEGTAVSSCWEVLGKAKSLAAELGTSAAAVVAGDGVDELAQQALSYGASAVYTAPSPVLARWLQPYTTVLDAAIDAADASVVLTSATNQGRILAATVACKRNAGLAPNASDLRGRRRAGGRTHRLLRQHRRRHSLRERSECCRRTAALVPHARTRRRGR
ncbi:MAG: hypothetical protein R2856_11170 [Caldilineaceae bacterium]